MDKLPKDLFSRLILSRLPVTDLLRAAEWSHRYYRLARANVTWESKVERLIQEYGESHRRLFNRFPSLTGTSVAAKRANREWELAPLRPSKKFKQAFITVKGHWKVFADVLLKDPLKARARDRSPWQILLVGVLYNSQLPITLVAHFDQPQICSFHVYKNGSIQTIEVSKSYETEEMVAYRKYIRSLVYSAAI